jgi:hypothetical protein
VIVYVSVWEDGIRKVPFFLVEVVHWDRQNKSSPWGACPERCLVPGIQFRVVRFRLSPSRRLYHELQNGSQGFSLGL